MPGNVKASVCTLGFLGIVVAAMGTKACTEDYYFANKVTVTSTTTTSSTETTDPGLTESPTTTSTTTTLVGGSTTTSTTVTTTTTIGGQVSRGLLKSLADLDDSSSDKGVPSNAVQKSAAGNKGGNWLGNLYNHAEIAGQAIDSDGDGYSDQLEEDFGTDLHDPKSFPNVVVTHLADRLNGLDDDRDGVLNENEKRLGLDPKNGDTDGDGVLDGIEIVSGSDPLDSRSVPTADNDGDGLSDQYEIGKGYDFQNQDTDGDGVLDSTEVILGMNPLSNDTDHDGILDGKELELGSDPTIPETRE